MGISINTKYRKKESKKARQRGVLVCVPARKRLFKGGIKNKKVEVVKSFR